MGDILLRSKLPAHRLAIGAAVEIGGCYEYITLVFVRNFAYTVLGNCTAEPRFATC